MNDNNSNHLDSAQRSDSPSGAGRVTLPLFPLRKGVLLPGATTTLPVGRAKSLDMFRRLKPGALIAVAIQKNPQVENPDITDLQPVGVLARVKQMLEERPGWMRVVIEAQSRLRIQRVLSVDPHWTAECEPLPEVSSTEATLLAASLVEVLAGAAQADELKKAIADIDVQTQPGLLADRVAASLQLESEKEIAVLQQHDVAERLRLVTRLVGEAHAFSEMRDKIQDEVRKGIGRSQKEAILREQMRAIRKELGEDGRGDDSEQLRKKILDAGLPDSAKEIVERELSRFESMNEAQMERGMLRTYLELVAALPWSKRAETVIDIEKVSAKLESDHFGLEEVKKRMLEHFAVLKVGANRKGTVLCLVGPPGVGKTSLGQSVADALGRPLVRVSLGGVRDEAEVRGHRRTYVGALPGRIVTALKQAKVKNPVVLLDEIDKLGQGWMGSPESALLEVLDPEQNGAFIDHYLELPFDLSEVLFVCTANALDSMSMPLRDRLEIIELSGYTIAEKLHIARQHLLPKQLKEHAMNDDALELSDVVLKAMISGYTREAGVRQLQRKIAKLCRALTLEVVRNPESKQPVRRIEEKDLITHLGKTRFFDEVAERTAAAGVATGLAWTPVGGDILFVETSRMTGKGMIEITGQLGDVMKESARAALSYVRSHADVLGLEPKFLAEQDLHIHFPAGGVPKDGPSAGVTIFTAITSLFTGRKVRSDTAMTGECTLRGRVLPVGGIKEKLIAAHRAGIKRVVIPKKNERDLADIPAATLAELEVILAEDMTDVLAAAFVEPLVVGVVEAQRGSERGATL